MWCRIVLSISLTKLPRQVTLWQTTQFRTDHNNTHAIILNRVHRAANKSRLLLIETISCDYVQSNQVWLAGWCGVERAHKTNQQTVCFSQQLFYSLQLGRLWLRMRSYRMNELFLTNPSRYARSNGIVGWCNGMIWNATKSDQSSHNSLSSSNEAANLWRHITSHLRTHDRLDVEKLRHVPWERGWRGGRRRKPGYWQSCIYDISE